MYRDPRLELEEPVEFIVKNRLDRLTKGGKMENQTNMENWQDTQVGTKDTPRLEAKAVKILSQTKIVVEGKKKVGTTYEKVVFSCKHPDRDEPIEISDVKYILNDKVEHRATWFSLDSEGKIQKSSALAALLMHYRAQSLSAIVGKEVMTSLDERGYLCIRAY